MADTNTTARSGLLQNWRTYFILFIGVILLLYGTGLIGSQPIEKYLGGAFPAQRASQNPYKVAFDNLTFDNPIAFNVVPQQERIVLGQLNGKIYWFDNDQDTNTKNLLVDLSDEVGLVADGGFLGLELHPDFGTDGNNFIFVYYATKDADGNNVPETYTIQNCDSEEYWGNFLILERFEVHPDNMAFVAESRTNVIKIRMYGTSHRGGGLDFGDDGFLYLSIGDQTAWKKAQDITNNIDGGVMRIDIDNDSTKSHPPVRTMPEDAGFFDETTGKEYWIPNDNPFLSPEGSNFEEYYSIGLRNPHRMTKDILTGTFYIGEIGLDSYEEINVLSKGKNYGWPLFEGNAQGPDPNCITELYNKMPHEKPLIVFENQEANSIIGGYVYRGTKIPQLYGKYICGDYGNGGEIWSVDTQTGSYSLLGNFLPSNIISFGQDPDGEIYLLKLGDSVNLYQMTTPKISYEGVPKVLSETGAFEDLATLTASDGLVPYELIESFWSDGALKKRWMNIPNDGTHDTPEERIHFSENGVWDFPDGSVLVKHFDLQTDENDPNKTKKIETRFSIKGEDGEFYFLSYKWNDEETDATLQEVGIDEPIAITKKDGSTRYQDWRYPSNTECITCHNTMSKGSLGLRTRYLNSDYNYTHGDTDSTANQLVALIHLGILDESISEEDTFRLLTHSSIDDPNASIDEKARSYLDLNCAYCHRPGTGNRSEFDLRLFNTLEQTGLLTAGTVTPMGIEGEKIIVPGDAEKSILYLRLNTLKTNAMMPPLAKSVLDEDAVTLIKDWINQIGGSTNQKQVSITNTTTE